MGFVYWLVALFCSPVPGGTAVAQPCHVDGQQVCCSWAYIVDRYCCHSATDPDCEDDCTEQERRQDYANALWGAERQCIKVADLIGPACSAKHWQHDGDGFEYYDRSPAVWSVLLWWFMPTVEPFDEHLECLRFNPHPEDCDGYADQH